MNAATMVLAILAGLIGGFLAAMVDHGRQMAGMRALMDRLEALARSAGGDFSPPQNRGAAVSEATDSDSSLSVLTGDVPDGRTTHVQELTESGQVRGLPLADQAIVRIHAALKEPLSPSEPSRRLDISLRSLERGLSMALDRSPRQHILVIKMREARRLLEAGELNVTAVAYLPVGGSPAPPTSPGGSASSSSAPLPSSSAGSPDPSGPLLRRHVLHAANEEGVFVALSMTEA